MEELHTYIYIYIYIDIYIYLCMGLYMEKKSITCSSNKVGFHPPIKCHNIWQIVQNLIKIIYHFLYMFWIVTVRFETYWFSKIIKIKKERFETYNIYTMMIP